jgi:hypothetical protein
MEESNRNFKDFFIIYSLHDFNLNVIVMLKVGKTR